MQLRTFYSFEYHFIWLCPQCQQTAALVYARNEQEQVRCEPTLDAHTRLRLRTQTSAGENECGHPERFPINVKAVMSSERKPQTTKANECYFVNKPLFNMLLALPSSIKTNDLSSVRHRGAKLSSCFHER